MRFGRVRTFTGAWIETGHIIKLLSKALVRTFTGAWIETGVSIIKTVLMLFAPSRVRGLKRLSVARTDQVVRSHLHGCVD